MPLTSEQGKPAGDELAPLLAVFRLAGGPAVGFGHVRRCWTMASWLADQGAKVRLVLDSPHVEPMLTEAGFSVVVEATPDAVDRTYEMLRLPGRKICIVDDPRLDGKALGSLGTITPVVCLDDVGERDFQVALVVNGSAGAETLQFRGASETRYLLGPRFIVLRPAFARCPQRSHTPAHVRTVLVLSGGAGSDDVSRCVVETVSRLLPDARVVVVAGPFASSSYFEEHPRRYVVVRRDPVDLRDLMLSADLAITGGGQTAYELAATATPTVGIRLAPNQELNLRGLAVGGALTEVGSPDRDGFEARLERGLRELAFNARRRRRMGLCGRQLVDGQGVSRVATELIAMADTVASERRAVCIVEPASR